MKKQIYTILLIAVCAMNANAQTNKPVAEKHSIEANVNLQVGDAPISLTAPAIKYRYFLKPNFALRTEIAATVFQNSARIYNNSFDDFATVKQSNWNLNFGVGVEYHFQGTDKLSPYMGMVVQIQTGGASQEGTNTFNGFSYSQGDQYSNYISGIFGIGTAAVIGADYYFLKNVFIGAEISYGYGRIFNGYQQVWSTRTNVTTETKLATFGSLGLGNSGIRLGMRF